ncbi:MAG: glycosyltransferase family 39 protein, partial [Candidatus Didemnitutus sp.]|nr:glycosyltransferase family 39 protein [Candidatus Didemnitutus sp.]
MLAVASVFFGFVWPTVDFARRVVQGYGYYVVAGTFGWAVYALVRLWPQWWAARPPVVRRELAHLGALIGGLTLIAALTVPYTYKVLYDEFVLQTTAWNMHEARVVGAAVRGYEIEGTFLPFGDYLDKRPYFYAFVLSLLHDVFGYREANAFALNTALMPLVLGLLYLVARRRVGHWPGLAAVAALGAFSLFAHNGTGAGMELLNLAMLLLVIELAAFYLARPDDEARLAALVLSALLLAQARYESGLYVLPVAIVVLEGWRRAGRIVLPLAAVLAPVLLIPYALHNTYLSGTPLLWELRAGDESRFGLRYLFANLAHARDFFFTFSSQVTNSTWLGYAGIPAFGWAAFRLLRALRAWRESRAADFAVAVFGATIAGGLGLLMFYYWGQLDDPIVARLSLPFSALLALGLADAAS